MTVLVKAEIEHEIDTNDLISDADKGNVKGCSYDLTIGTIFSEGRIINANSPEAKAPHIVPPGGVISILTREQINLPTDIMATAFPINTMSSKGFMVLNPGHVDPGFRGALSVKAVNLRKTGLPLQLGTPVFTVIFERLHTKTCAFGRNKLHVDRERDFNAPDIEVSPQTLSSLIQLDRNGPYRVRDEVNNLIRQHWMSRTSFWFTLIAAIAALWLR